MGAYGIAQQAGLLRARPEFRNLTVREPDGSEGTRFFMCASMPLVSDCHSAIAKPLGRHAFGLNKNRHLVLPAEIPASFSDAMLRAHREIALGKFASARRARGAIGARWNVELHLPAREVSLLPREHFRFANHRSCSFACHNVASCGPYFAKKFKASLKSKKSLCFFAPPSR
jgi:hypothetical protein